VDLRLVAECVDTDLTTLTQLNPSLLRLTTPKDAVYDLRLPAGTKDQYLEAINAIPVDKRVAWRYHHVAAGESLESIARHYHTSTRAIEQANNLSSGKLQADSKLIIPVTAGHSSASEVAYSRKPTRYKVRRGDTVLSVADDFGVSAARLRHWNRLKGNELHSGRMLVIYRPVMPAENAVINSPRLHSRRAHSSSRHARSNSHSRTARHSSQEATTKTASKSGVSTHTVAKSGGDKSPHPPSSGTSARSAAALQ
jgi:membrane-bound lytic murein transglycosylase D